MILERLLEHACGLPERTVTDLRLGLGYTGVTLDDGGTGVAHTPREEDFSTCSVLNEAGTFRERLAQDMAQLAHSTRPLEAAVGLATLNALCACNLPPCSKGDVLNFLKITKADNVAMVGHFHPLVEPLKRRARALYILERKKLDDEGFYPSEKASEILPLCQVVLITSVTLINKTFDELIHFAGKAREVVLMGPTTPLLATVFRAVGVTLLGGIRVLNGERLLQVISEGGGTRHFGSSVEKVVVKT